jgi:5-formyltetrahydrofolate cyclo-ligase
LQQRWLQAARPGVVSYLAMPDEVDLDEFHAVVQQTGQPVWLPRVVGDGELRWHPVCHQDCCCSGAYGIREPDPDRVAAGQPPGGAWVLVPGTAFDRDGRRLGMGGGFYDRQLEQLRQSGGRLIGMAYAEQILDRVPVEAHDQRVQELLVDGEWWAVAGDQG